MDFVTPAEAVLETKAIASEATEAAFTVNEEKMDRLSRQLDAAIQQSRRPGLGISAPVDYAAVEHKSAFETYVRSGSADRLRQLEAKALNGAVGPDGGYLVPAEAERAILARIAGLSPIRGIATVRSLANAAYKKAVSPTGTNAGWTFESSSSSAFDPASLAEINFPTMDLFAQPAATQTMLDDAAVDIEAWIGEEIELAFAQAESAAFVNGDGINHPKGFLAYPTVANTAWEWGKLGTVSTGAAGAFPASNPSDVLIDLVYSLKSAYRQNAVFVMNRKTQSAIRKFKDANGNYLWAPPATIGARATLMNFPVVEVEDMPDIGADAPAIAFGDFRRGYLVVDRIGIRALRDPYSAKPYVLFYTTKRVGGGVQDFEAIKLLKFSA